MQRLRFAAALHAKRAALAATVVTWGFADVIVSSAHINEQQCSFAQSANLHSITCDGFVHFNCLANRRIKFTHAWVNPLSRRCWNLILPISDGFPWFATGLRKKRWNKTVILASPINTVFGVPQKFTHVWVNPSDT